MDGELRVLPDLVLTATLEASLSAYLTRSDGSREQLRNLDGRTIELRIEPSLLTLYLIPHPNGLQIRTTIAGTPDVSLSGTPLALMRVASSEFPPHRLSAAGITVSGDAETAQMLQNLMRSSRIDWQALVASVTGESLAGALFRDLAGVRDWVRSARHTLTANLAEFLQEESRDLPSAAEADALLGGIDRLRDDCERLAARVERLTARRAGASAGTPDARE
ncbi:MAG: SCP2 sterol-binding domain-containing protein [Methylotetracoccus sp.]